jgi:hypothetical protein
MTEVANGIKSRANQMESIKKKAIHSEFQQPLTGITKTLPYAKDCLHKRDRAYLLLLF